MPTSNTAAINAASRPLTQQDYKTLSLAALGGALEFYDFIIFVFFANAIGQLFFPPEMPEWLRLLQTFGIFAAGYVVRPLGGIVMAHFGDLLGRKRMFTLSILMMAVPTLLIGLLPTYATIGLAAPLLLLLMRIFQGAAVGGEDAEGLQQAQPVRHFRREEQLADGVGEEDEDDEIVEFERTAECGQRQGFIVLLGEGTACGVDCGGIGSRHVSRSCVLSEIAGPSIRISAV